MGLSTIMLKNGLINHIYNSNSQKQHEEQMIHYQHVEQIADNTIMKNMCSE